MAEVIRTNFRDPQEFIEAELATARDKAQPISRRMLIQRLIKEYAMAYPIAEKVVEDFCDEQAAYTPEYLGSEFFKPYAKLTGLFFAILSLVLLGMGASHWRNHQISWPFFAAGAILFLFSGIGIMKVLRVEQEEYEA